MIYSRYVGKNSGLILHTIKYENIIDELIGHCENKKLFNILSSYTVFKRSRNDAPLNYYPGKSSLLQDYVNKLCDCSCCANNNETC